MKLMSEQEKDDLTAGMRYHHTATARGYISRKLYGIASEYNGAFGKGVMIRRPRTDSNSYHYVEYYVEVSKNA